MSHSLVTAVGWELAETVEQQATVLTYVWPVAPVIAVSPSPY